MSGLCFECTQCGKCCTNRGEYAHVYATDAELGDMAKLMGLTRAQFRKRYAFVDEDGWTQLKTNGDGCVFLDLETGACGVYGARPTQCRTFPFWREFVEKGKWTDEVRALCEGIGRGEPHPAEYVESQMLEMERAEEEAELES